MFFVISNCFYLNLRTPHRHMMIWICRVNHLALILTHLRLVLSRPRQSNWTSSYLAGCRPFHYIISFIVLNPLFVNFDEFLHPPYNLLRRCLISMRLNRNPWSAGDFTSPDYYNAYYTWYYRLSLSFNIQMR